MTVCQFQSLHLIYKFNEILHSVELMHKAENITNFRRADLSRNLSHIGSYQASSGFINRIKSGL